MASYFGLFISFFAIAVPLAAVAFFVVSLCLYISAQNRNRQTSDSASIRALSTAKILLIVSSVILGVILAVSIGVVILFSMSIRYM